MKRQILIIEDDNYIAELIEFNLKKKGCGVIRADNANDGLVFLQSMDIDLMLLDLMLPGLQGEEFLSLVKSRPSTKDIPIMIITAKTQEDLFVKLLEMGADDFLVKPFSIKLLVAKVEALLRRINKLPTKISLCGIDLDVESYTVKIEGKDVDFTQTQFEILRLLLTNPNKVFSRDDILKNIWGDDPAINDRTIDVHISKIRKKLKDKSEHLKAIPRVGYKFVV
ncbi:response regulator [Hippea jasoniae]|uniref:response regulator n=1 Tax=Hippea jasoniae TaxID=944479 RepID=UPI0005558DF8|nr:response regulator [Hippea jasoniae]